MLARIGWEVDTWVQVSKFLRVILQRLGNCCSKVICVIAVDRVEGKFVEEVMGVAMGKEERVVYMFVESVD